MKSTSAMSEHAAPTRTLAAILRGRGWLPPPHGRRLSRDAGKLVVNLKTARTLGITIPESILLRADEVIR